MAPINYDEQRNKLWKAMRKRKKANRKPFLLEKYSFQEFYNRFFKTKDDFESLYEYLTTTKTDEDKFFYDPDEIGLNNFYFNLACDLSYAPKQYCKPSKTKFSGNYYDGPTELTIEDTSGNLSFVLKVETPIDIPLVRKIDKFSGNLTHESGNTYIHEEPWGQEEFDFIETANGNIKEIIVKISTKKVERIGSITLATFRFTKSAFPSQDNAEDDEEQEPEVVETTYDCILNYIGSHGIKKLNKGASGERYVNVSRKTPQNEDTQYVFYKDGKIIWRVANTGKSLRTGTWECGEDGESFIVKWDSGDKRIEKYGVSDLDVNEPTGSSNSAANPKTKCEKILPCPKTQDVISGKARFTLCMKCDEIKKIKEAQSIRDLYVGYSGSENFDDIFDEYLEKTITDFQRANGIQKSGAVGNMTYERLFPKKITTTQTPTQPNSTPTTQTGTQQEPAIANKNMKW